MLATMVVPPMHEVQLFGQGYIAAAISPRKIKLLNADMQYALSASYGKFDAVEQMSFGELVRFVINKNKAG